MPEPTVMESTKEKTKAYGHHVNQHEDVVFSAKQDCSVLFENGIELKLKAGKSTSIAFAKDGTYPFTVNKGQCDPTSPIIVPRH
jgi:hypothetical protein